MIEALTDPKTWLFALFAVFDNIPNSIVNQLQIIIVSFGFNPLQTTLLGCVSGVAEIVVIFTGVTIASRVPNSIAWVGIASFIPSLLGLFRSTFYLGTIKLDCYYPSGYKVRMTFCKRWRFI